MFRSRSLDLGRFESRLDSWINLFRLLFVGDNETDNDRVTTQTRINERMSKIYDLCKAQKDSVEKRVDEEQRIDTETHERRAQEKEMKRVQVSTLMNLTNTISARERFSVSSHTQTTKRFCSRCCR